MDSVSTKPPARRSLRQRSKGEQESVVEERTLPEEVRAAFESAACCFLATSADDVPNVVPVGFKWIVGRELYLADFFFDKTRRNLEKNAAVAVTVATTAPSKRGFQVKGHAVVHKEGSEFERITAFLQTKGVSSKPHSAIVVPLREVYELAPGARAGKRIL